MHQVRHLPDKLLSNGCMRRLIERHTQVSLLTIRHASQMAAVAKREGGAESSLHSKHEKILGGGPSLTVIFISQADPSQEMDGVGVMRLKITEAGEHKRTEVEKHKHVERHGDEGTHKSIFSKNDQWRD